MMAGISHTALIIAGTPALFPVACDSVLDLIAATGLISVVLTCGDALPDAHALRAPHAVPLHCAESSGGFPRGVPVPTGAGLHKDAHIPRGYPIRVPRGDY
jgi:hypothetical protein